MIKERVWSSGEDIALSAERLHGSDLDSGSNHPLL